MFALSNFCREALINVNHLPDISLTKLVTVTDIRINSCTGVAAFGKLLSETSCELVLKEPWLKNTSRRL